MKASEMDEGVLMGGWGEKKQTMLSYKEKREKMEPQNDKTDRRPAHREKRRWYFLP